MREDTRRPRRPGGLVEQRLERTNRSGNLTQKLGGGGHLLGCPGNFYSGRSYGTAGKRWMSIDVHHLLFTRTLH